MSRSHGRILTRIWKDRDFLALDQVAQRWYLFLISQEDLNHAGLLPLRVRRWASSAAGVTPDDVHAALKVLDAARFVVVDEDTEEVLIRTLVRNDGVYKQPKVMIRMGQDAQQITSLRLRAVFAEEMRRLPFGELTGTQRREAEAVALALALEFAPGPDTLPHTLTDTHPEGSAEGYPGGYGEPSREGSSIPSACAHAHSPGPLPPSPSPRLLTFVGRLAVSDARVSDCPPAEVVESWQRVAGPDVDLEHEAAQYLARFGMRPATDEAAAWVGWLRKAHERAARARGTPPLGCARCVSGWLPDDLGFASPAPCPSCKPHTTGAAE